MIQFENRVSVGHILTAIPICAGLFWGYITNGYELQELRTKELANEQSILELKTVLSTYESNTNALLSRLQDLLTELRVEDSKHGHH